MQGYCGCPCCGGQNFRAALRRTPPILTAATGSGPPSCQPIPGHCRGRQSGHFLEIASLILPQAALRRFPRFIRHRRRSDRSPRARSALAMTGFLARGVEKRGVQEAAPYGCMAGKRGAQGITDCHSQCAHWLRNDRLFGKGCGEAGRPGGRPLRVHGWKVRCTGDYGLPSQCAHWLGNDREVGKMTWGVRGGEMGWRCELPRPGRVVAMIIVFWRLFTPRARRESGRRPEQNKSAGWWHPQWW